MSDVSKTDNPDGSTININVDNNRISSVGLAGIICGAVAISVIIIMLQIMSLVYYGMILI